MSQRSISDDDSRLKWHGDKMTFNNDWPNTDKRDTIRFFTINHNGITSYNDYLEWEMAIATIVDMQVDIFGITEPNLDFNKGIVRENVTQKARHFDKYMRLSLSSSKQKISTSPFKTGGTITGTNGCWSGRLEKAGSDVMGRWSYLALRGRGGQQVNIVTVYVPNKPSRGGGGTTVYSQMELDYLQIRKKIANPRKALLKDLSQFISKEHQEGNVTILMGDFNDDLSKEDGEVRIFLDQSGMTLSSTSRHGPEFKLPATHDRGSKCLDMIAHSKTIDATAIQRMGFAPFYTNFSTDHRGLYMDVNIKKLFNYTRPDTTRPIYKRFTTLHVTKCERYLHKLEELMETSRIFQSVDLLQQTLRSTNPDPIKTNEAIERCKTLFKKVTEFMHCSEKHSGSIPYTDGYPNSPKLKEAAFTVVRIKKYLRMVSLGILPGKKVEQKKAQEDLKNAQINLRAAQQNSYELRQEYLAVLAEKRASQWNMKATEALHILNEAEESKRTHEKQRRILKPNQHGTLRSLLVPAPVTGFENNIKDSRLYTEVYDTQTMFDLLLRRNFEQLRQSRASAHGPLLEKCGWYGEGPGLDELLDGLIDVDTMGKHYPEFGKEGKEFLRALRRPQQADAPDFDWDFGLKEYMDVFNRTKESTACGPSGLHMSHWKAACERPRIAAVHAFFYLGGV